MIARDSFRLFGWCCCVVLLSSSSARAEVIYREIFPNSTGNNLYGAGAGNDGTIAAGWSSHINTNADVMPPGNDGARLVSAFGRPSTLGLLPISSNANPAHYAGVSGNELGFVRGWQHSVGQVIFWTNEYTINRSQWNIDTISWFQGHDTTGDASRVAVRVATGSGDAWYVSQTSFNQIAGISNANFVAGFSTLAEEKSLDFPATLWQSLNFVPGVALGDSLGAPGALPDGNITAFGLYSTSGQSSGWHTFDTFTISATAISASAVPEPTALAIWIAGVVALVAGARIVRQRSTRKSSAG